MKKEHEASAEGKEGAAGVSAAAEDVHEAVKTSQGVAQSVVVTAADSLVAAGDTITHFATVRPPSKPALTLAPSYMPCCVTVSSTIQHITVQYCTMYCLLYTHVLCSMTVQYSTVLYRAHLALQALGHGAMEAAQQAQSAIQSGKSKADAAQEGMQLKGEQPHTGEALKGAKESVEGAAKGAGDAVTGAAKGAGEAVKGAGEGCSGGQGQGRGKPRG